MPTHRHNIPHIWSVKRCKNPNKGRCMSCNLSMGFLSVFEKCRSCKVCVHPECKWRVQDNCGFTSRHFKALFTHMVVSAGQDNWAPNIGTSRSMNDIPPTIQYTDPQTPTIVDSSSSANSSTPSTPAGLSAGLVPTISVHPPQSHITADRLTAPPRTVDLPSRSKQFTFPEVTSTSVDLDSSESANSSLSNGSAAFSGSNKWDRRAWNVLTIRHGSTWKELTIPLREIKFDQIIGCGRFSDVYQVNHFGTVAMKLPRMDHIEEDKRVEVFKQEAACYQNVRHENLVFFCGYTLDPSKLGIVLERFRGPSLYTYLHESTTESAVDFNDAVDFAKQICQGMSYLQTKNILHKDLRSKNVFIENRKAIITDFGLFNVKRLMYPKRNNGFVVPDRWLCYQAPEFLRVLHENLDQFHFNEKTDVFAFGTIWYELLTRNFPFQGLNSQTIIFQVGFGMKSSLGKLNVNREAKTLLMQCWTHNPVERTTFVDVLKKLEAMPRKTLRRSPSFPAYKSYESVF